MDLLRQFQEPEKVSLGSLLLVTRIYSTWFKFQLILRNILNANLTIVEVHICLTTLQKDQQAIIESNIYSICQGPCAKVWKGVKSINWQTLIA